MTTGTAQHRIISTSHRKLIDNGTWETPEKFVTPKGVWETSNGLWHQTKSPLPNLFREKAASSRGRKYDTFLVY